MKPRQGTAAALASLLLLAGCGGGDSGGSGGSSDPAPRSANVNIKDFKYGPAEVRVALGGTLTFVNGDRADHTATTSDGAAAEFDTGRLATGDSKPVKLSEAGSYAYICTFHPYMKGTVVVAGGDGNG
jgi:plastocyanin